MLLGVIAAVAMALPIVQQADTVIPVRAGTRLQIENFNGSTIVRTWDRSAVRIVADGDDRNRLDIRNLGTVLNVKTQSRYGSPRSVDYQITVPVRTDLSINGVYNDVSVEGVQGAISVETVNGDVDVKGGDGFISLKSVEGGVRLSGARGRISLSSVNDDVTATDVTGDLSVEGVNGDVTLIGIASPSVSATTVNGDLVYDGSIQPTGQYSLSTHNGDVDVTVPADANATVNVSTFQGDFEPSGIAVVVSQISRNRFTFLLGAGSGRLNLESFQGTIRLHRPGELRRGSRGAGVGSGSGSGSSDNNPRNRSRNRNNDDDKRHEEER